MGRSSSGSAGAPGDGATRPIPAARIAGAWLELTDRYEEAGVDTPDRATPLEAVRSMVEVDDAAAATSAQLVGLAREVDRAAYDRISPPPEAADVAWRYSDEAVDALLANQSLPRRTRMRVDPRTLRRRDPLAGVATLDGPTIGHHGRRTMSRTDDPTVLPDGDDEITTDVDPAWVASIRAETRGSASSAWSGGRRRRRRGPRRATGRAPSRCGIPRRPSARPTA